MATYDNNLTGALFKNERKETSNHPDYKGSAEIDGEEYWIAAWLKTSKSGDKFMSLAFTVKDGAKVGKNQTGKTKGDDVDSDIPF